MDLSPEQHYPTYNYRDRDVVAAELQEAYKEAAGQGRLYTQLTSVLLGTATLAFSLVRFDIEGPNSGWFSGPSLFWVALAASFIGAQVLLYFVDLQKSIIINRRKVVVLRTMLGLDYGHVQMILPSDRIEGAVNPFMIRMFAGWFSYVSLPYWLIVLSTSALWASVNEVSILEHTWVAPWHFWVWWIALFSVLFRSRLCETHEDYLLLTIRGLARTLRLRLVPSPEYALYRSKLAAIELERLGFETSTLATMAVMIEDHRFWSHRGVSLRSFVRASAYVIPALRDKYELIPSGASTITMQLARTLFIVDYQKTLRRKLVESLLALWLERHFSKTQILEMYLGSVRFARGVFGLAAASKHFFNKRKRDFSPEEAFLLIERLSATTSTYGVRRIRSLIMRVQDRAGSSDGQLESSDVMALYQAMPLQAAPR